VKIGTGSSIGDRTMIHCSKYPKVVSQCLPRMHVSCTSCSPCPPAPANLLLLLLLSFSFFSSPSLYKDLPALVGDGVVVGAGSILHGCVLEDSCMVGHCNQSYFPILLLSFYAYLLLFYCLFVVLSQVGAGAQILDGASVGRQAVVAPGSVVGSGKQIPAGQMWGGVPAKFVREVSAEEVYSV
jgi:carbonic anhydrase/acetyltransferase-like protein (isoleucine patch superfamily)